MEEAPVENDDLGKQMVEAPKPTRAELIARARAKEQQHRQQIKRIEAINNAEVEVEEAGFFTDTAPHEKDGFLDNTKEVAFTAVETAAEGIVNFVGNAGDDFSSEETPYLVFGTDKSLDDVGVDIFGMNIGFVKKKEFDLRRIAYEIESGEKAVTLADFDIPDADRPDSAAGKMAADMARWLVIFAATRKSLGNQFAGTSIKREIALGATSGFAADLTAFAPHEERLSNMIVEWGKDNPAFDNAVTQYIASDSDSATEASLKHAIEGLGLGMATEGVFMTIKWLKGLWKNREFKNADISDTAIDNIKPKPDDAPLKELEGILPDDSQTTKFLKEKAAADAAQGKTPAVKAAADDVTEGAAEAVEQVERTMKDTAKSAITFKSTIDKEAFVEAFNNGEFSKLGEMVEFNENTIDWSKADNPEGLKDLLRGLEEAASDFLGEAGQAKVSFKATKQMAHDVGISEANAHSLFGDTQAGGGLAARMLAAQQAMVANAKRLYRLGEAAKGGDQQAVALFHSAIEQQAALMGVVKGSSREIARALANMRQMKDAAADSFEAFGQIMERHGGIEGTRELVDTLISQNNLAGLHRVVQKHSKPGFLDWIQEVAINGMLSSIKTHVINITSNSAMGFLITPIERLMAGTIGLRHNRYALGREARAVIATYTSIPYATRLMLKAAKTGAPVADSRQRIEVLQRRAIRADTSKWHPFLKPVANMINLTGEAIRLPGRALVTADEFFKGVTRMGEMTGFAWEAASRQADIKKLKGAERTRFIKTEMKKLLDNPTDAMQDEATAAARRATFQEDAHTAVGGKIASALNSHPVIKLVVAPFVKTPMNLLRQAFMDRNPVLSLFAKKNMAELRQGGAAADAVIARMMTGAGVMWMGWEMAESGFITGKGEAYHNTEKLDKVPEYSIKYGDEWIPYNRLDPVGGMLGMIADLHYGFARGYDPMNPEGFTEMEHASRAIFLAATNNALSKTWAKSMNDIIETGELWLDGSVGSSRRAIDKIKGENLFKLVPYGSAIRNYAGAEDPIIREAWSVTERMLKNLPGYSEGLPIKRDLLGRPITRQNAESFMYNPFAPMAESKDPVDIALADLQFDSTLIDKSIEGVPLNATQYSRYKELIGDFNIPGAPTLHDELLTVIESSGWDQMTDLMKVDIVKGVISSRKKTAKQLLLNEGNFELRKRVMQLDIYNLEKYTEQDLSEVKEAIDSITN